MPTVAKRLHVARGLYSTVWDYRATTPANGGLIHPQACVHHIPVMGDAPGHADFDALRRVLIDKGLMVQFSTDNPGNVAMFTRFDRLCYHARGGNVLTTGIEHMHVGIGDAWSERQMRAAAWIAQYLAREGGIPLRMADVEAAAPGLVRIARTGHTSHQQIARLAGYNDRVDPGRGFDYEKMFALAVFFQRHGHFVNA